MYHIMQHQLQDLLMSKTVTCYESRKGPINPATDEDHGKHIGDIAFHHICQHAGICENRQKAAD